MARPRATEEQRQAQRRRIRRAALEIYDEDGLAAISIRGVATRAGVSHGTIYSYYADRSTLLRSLWLEPVLEVGRQLEQTSAEIDDPVERIRTLLTRYVDFALKNPDIHRNAMLFVRPTKVAESDVSPAENLVFFRLMSEAVGELTKSAGLPLDDPKLSAELLWSAVHGALGLAINNDIFELRPAADLAPKMVDLLMRTIVEP